jgi:hypothetical protein
MSALFGKYEIEKVPLTCKSEYAPGKNNMLICLNAGMAELVDAPDLGSGGIPCPSSSLGACTNNLWKNDKGEMSNLVPEYFKWI